jgi:hypothetical protein
MFLDNFIKSQLLKQEIRFYTHSIIRNTGFSEKTKYVLFKRQSLGFVFNSNGVIVKKLIVIKAINAKLRLSKSRFKEINNLGFLTGFYHAM